MGLGFWVGRWADGKLGTKYLTLVGLALGVFAGFRNLMKAANEMQREADREADLESKQLPSRTATRAPREGDGPSPPRANAPGNPLDGPPS